MSSYLPNGFRARRPAASDVEVAAAVLQAEERAVRGESTWGIAETLDWWRLSNLEHGTWIVEAADGTPAAFAAMIEHGDSPTCWASVHPQFNGRGLATALIRRAETRAREIGATNLKVGAFAENDTAPRLFADLGYAEARRYYRMQIDLDRPPAQPEWPAGTTVATFRRENARAFHDTLDEAFSEEWGHHSLPFEEWKRFRVEAPDVDLSFWFLAWDGDEVAGVCRCDAKKHEGGWIGALGVRKHWRRRGLGLALLLHAFGEFHARGATHVGLGVDAENASGAIGLYERAGMRVLTEDVVFEKKLR